MPDISMCQNKDCLSRKTCYLFMATPNQYRQSYMAYVPDEGETKCSSYSEYYNEKQIDNIPRVD